MKDRTIFIIVISAIAMVIILLRKKKTYSREDLLGFCIGMIIGQLIYEAIE